jgi:4-aminobutyrate aminotransferase/(S)-3-amino-2-methylpropionate transaminase
MSHWPVYKLMPLRKALPPSVTTKLSNTFHNIMSKVVEPYEAAEPKIITKYPGPKALAFNESMSQTIANSDQLREVINLENSFGNYFEDVDGNVVLDMFMDNGRNAFGYNSRRWIKETKLQKYDKFLYQRPAIGVLPPVEYPKLLHELLMKVGPDAISEVYLSCGCGSSANLNAFKFAFLKKFFDLKGTDKITAEEERSILIGQQPGAPKFSILGFEGGYHGKFLDELSLSNYNTNNSIASHNWPIAPFPKLKLPYEDNCAFNRAEETRCVEETAKLMKQHKDSLAAMIIEPLQLTGGVRYASNMFYKDLVDLCYDNDIAFICDETNTSGWAGGRPFMHANWNLEKPAHFVTFGGRMQLAGFFYQKQFRPKHGNMISSTWNGDIAKLIQFFDTYDQITRVDWIDAHTEQFWQGCKAELLDLQRKAKIPISNIRGIGKIFAFDVEHTLLRDEIIHLSRQNGFKVAPNGSTSIAFTPSLLFTEVHLARYKDFFEKLIPSTLNGHHFNNKV